MSLERLDRRVLVNALICAAAGKPGAEWELNYCVAGDRVAEKFVLSTPVNRM